MSNQTRIIESRQQSSQKIKEKNKLSSNTLGSINKVNTEKKIFKDLSINFLKNFNCTTLSNKTCVNHSHKKIVIKEKSRMNNNNNKKLTLNLNNHNKYSKFPLKLNYKQSISLKNLIEEENILNAPLRSSDKRKNTNTKIELFSTNSTLSFLNIKDNNKESSKPIKIKCFKNYNNSKNNFSSTFIEKKLRQKSKSNSKIKIKHIKNNLSLDKKLNLNVKKYNKNKNLKENTFNNSNKSIEFCLSYMKPINKRRNLSIGINENSNSNTNSIKEFYNLRNNPNKFYSSNMLLDNMSISLNKNKNNENSQIKRRAYSISKKINLNTYYKPGTINNNSKNKFNLSSLPNLLYNNCMNKHNFTLSTNDLFNIKDKNRKIMKYNKNKSSKKNLFEQKKIKKNYIKIKNIDYKTKNKKISLNKINNNKDDKNINIKIKHIKTNNNNNEYNRHLNSIHIGVKSLLDGLYNIYLKANKTTNNIININ